MNSVTSAFFPMGRLQEQISPIYHACRLWLTRSFLLGLPITIVIPNIYVRVQQSTLQGAASTQGHALVVGAERKLAAHVVACRAAGIAFVPLVVESLGGWSNEAADTITKIGRCQGHRLGVPPAESIRHLFQCCAITLWRGNASMWIHRLPAHPPVVDGIL